VAEQQAVPIQVQHKQQQQQLQHLENSDDKAKLTKQKEGAAGPSGDAGPAPGDAGSVGPPASWTLARKGRQHDAVLDVQGSTSVVLIDLK
jgi:hypothetical protein